MNRLLTLALASLVLISMFTFGAYAQGGPTSYQTFTAASAVTVDVEIPILVTADGGQADLGAIAPGTTRAIPGNANLIFTVSGAFGWLIDVSATFPSTLASAGTNGGTVSVNNVLWFEEGNPNIWTNRPGTPGDNGMALCQTNLGGFLHNINSPADHIANLTTPTSKGLKRFKVVVGSIAASNLAEAGTYSFPVTLTASYAPMTLANQGY